MVILSCRVWMQEPAKIKVCATLILPVLALRLRTPLKLFTPILPALALAVMMLGVLGAGELKLAGRVTVRSIVSPSLPPKMPLLLAGVVALASRQELARQAGSVPCPMDVTLSLICLN